MQSPLRLSGSGSSLRREAALRLRLPACPDWRAQAPSCNLSSNRLFRFGHPGLDHCTSDLNRATSKATPPAQPRLGPGRQRVTALLQQSEKGGRYCKASPGDVRWPPDPGLGFGCGSAPGRLNVGRSESLYDFRRPTLGFFCRPQSLRGP
ncbi:uncharacterized protein B0I36DRAFT_90838 [Microdochium trichocladiopsis]|uniref:Uncharacterized protein n=1 Tax=Microdochium trichocladiopsis TaxID=1682393 RepID=A0A9P8YB84_9PEZI|nr:uncharacterized protein B0I36DRAFT_90838 [Microdochium trichocladiopsis]KAH7035303.1 hypothetical protein B0I36DRAFT_90838 [Microdochium trichocladiopsis]